MIMGVYCGSRIQGSDFPPSQILGQKGTISRIGIHNTVAIYSNKILRLEFWAQEKVPAFQKPGTGSTDTIKFRSNKLIIVGIVLHWFDAHLFGKFLLKIAVAWQMDILRCC